MDGWKKAYKNIVSRPYLLLLSLVALCGYGFKVCHPAIGVDDTPYAYYFQEGLAAIVGRWVLFLLDKVVRISEYAPFLTDLAAVLILMAAVTVWTLLFYRILGEEVPRYGYWFFAGIFLSCPLISEVFTYFLHNGIAIGYLCCGISVCLFWEGMRPQAGKGGILGRLGGSVLFLVIALGCYESFMIVWLVGILLTLIAEHVAGNRCPVVRRVCAAAVCAAAGMVLRSVVIALVIRMFHLQYLRGNAVQRSLAEMAGWILEPDAGARFVMVLKRVFVMYGVFGYAYYPIRIFVAAVGVIALYCLWQTIRRRDAWIILLAGAAFIACFLLIFLEGSATLYRAAQFLPLICGFGALLFVCAASRLGVWVAKRKAFLGKNAWIIGIRSCTVFVLAVILWNQCADLNKWFYVDYRKYEYCRELAGRIAYALESEFDTSKPVFFTGEWECPKSIIGDAYVDYDSRTFYKMKRITDPVDEHLLEKFYRGYGVWVAQTPSLTVINWGRYAFDTDEELIRFFAMHGYELQPFLEQEEYRQAEVFSLDLPVFPQKGSIVDMGDYIIVHL